MFVSPSSPVVTSTALVPACCFSASLARSASCSASSRKFFTPFFWTLYELNIVFWCWSSLTSSSFLTAVLNSSVAVSVFSSEYPSFEASPSFLMTRSAIFDPNTKACGEVVSSESWNRRNTFFRCESKVFTFSFGANVPVFGTMSPSDFFSRWTWLTVGWVAE